MSLNSDINLENVNRTFSKENVGYVLKHTAIYLTVAAVAAALFGGLIGYQGLSASHVMEAAIGIGVAGVVFTILSYVLKKKAEAKLKEFNEMDEIPTTYATDPHTPTTKEKTWKVLKNASAITPRVLSYLILGAIVTATVAGLANYQHIAPQTLMGAGIGGAAVFFITILAARALQKKGEAEKTQQTLEMPKEEATTPPEVKKAT